MFRYFKDLDKLASALRVDHFATMGDELKCRDSQDLAVEVLAWMEAHNFDIIPVEKDGEKSFFIDREKDLTDLADGEIIANRMKPVNFNMVHPDVSIKDALTELVKKEWFFVGTDSELKGIVTLADLGKPTVSFYLLSNLLMLESGFRRLLGSYTDTQIPDAAPEYGDTFPRTINEINKTKDLKTALNLPLGDKYFRKSTKYLIDLRNALAHGRSIVDEYNDISEAIDCINKLESLLRDVGSLIEERKNVWEKFVKTHVVKRIDIKEIGKLINIREIWAGNNAMPNLPMNFPIYVISVANPLEEVLSTDENEQRHRGLHAILKSRKLKFEEVFGESPNGKWSEASFAIEGISKKDACELAQKFEQRAIFELTQDQIRVISVDGECQREDERCRYDS